MTVTRDLSNMSRRIIGQLLGEESPDVARINEATVHLPRRSRIWQAVFTGPAGGQVWRSTGLTDRDQALLVALRWEAEARQQRANLVRRPVVRFRHSGAGTGAGLTQEEVARLMHLSVRAVREIEKRAIRKLFNHPLLRQLWQDYSVRHLDEDRLALASVEIAALFSLVKNSAERRLIHKVLRLTTTPGPESSPSACGTTHSAIETSAHQVPNKF
jgi:hypothetical protein